MRLPAKLAIGAPTAVVGYLTYDYLMGRSIVKQLCAKDGGLRIYETQYAHGFLDESSGECAPSVCSECFERLAKGEFEYIDVRVPGDPATVSPLAIQQPGYCRLSLAPADDARCKMWYGSNPESEQIKLQRAFGVTATQCVAVSRMPALPEHFDDAVSPIPGAVPGPDGIPGIYGEYQMAAQMGNDHIDAGGGNDIVVTRGGNDTVSGGAGDDILIDSHAGWEARFATSTSYFYDWGSTEWVNKPGHTSNDTLSGDAGNDFIAAHGGKRSGVVRTLHEGA